MNSRSTEIKETIYALKRPITELKRLYCSVDNNSNNTLIKKTYIENVQTIVKNLNTFKVADDWGGIKGVTPLAYLMSQDVWFDKGFELTNILLGCDYIRRNIKQSSILMRVIQSKWFCDLDFNSDEKKSEVQDLIKLLLSHGADPNIAVRYEGDGQDFKTVLDVAYNLLSEGKIEKIGFDFIRHDMFAGINLPTYEEILKQEIKSLESTTEVKVTGDITVPNTMLSKYSKISNIFVGGGVGLVSCGIFACVVARHTKLFQDHAEVTLMAMISVVFCCMIVGGLVDCVIEYSSNADKRSKAVDLQPVGAQALVQQHGL